MSTISVDSFIEVHVCKLYFYNWAQSLTFCFKNPIAYTRKNKKVGCTICFELWIISKLEENETQRIMYNDFVSNNIQHLETPQDR